MGRDLSPSKTFARRDAVSTSHKAIARHGDGVLDDWLFTDRDRVQQPDLRDTINQHRDLILVEIAQPITDGDAIKRNYCQCHLAHDATPSAVTSSASTLSMAAMAV